jgi:conjugative relaxase-like TrwC/TraI family protein
MVATWNPAANAGYYIREAAAYYVGGHEPAGLWYAPGRDFCLTDGAEVEREAFERLYAGVDTNGLSLLSNTGRKLNRVAAFDFTLSAPRSVALVWAFAPEEKRQAVETAQARAVRATLEMLEREATWARRGKGGAIIEKVSLSAAVFQHGESRSAKHADGRVFADPNLHNHCVCFNISARGDGTVGALHSKILRDFKMAAGGTYHAALAHELEKIGFAIDRIGKNATFEIAGVRDETIKYFSARRAEIEDELRAHDTTSKSAPALAAAITKSTRSSKRETAGVSREHVWKDAARALGVDTEHFVEHLIDPTRLIDAEANERLLRVRLQELPDQLTETQSVVDRRDLVRSVSAALVGTGLPAERAQIEIDRLLNGGAVTEVGRDVIGLPRYSTPELITIERNVVDYARDLAMRTWHEVDQHIVVVRCKAMRLNAEQTNAAMAATGRNALDLCEGAPGSGKTSTLSPIVTAYKNAGYRVIGGATAWRIANKLRDDLHIESRAIASWIEKARSGESVLDDRTVLILDEAGLLSSREMHAVLELVARSKAKLLLCGDRRQLQPIGAGSGLSLVARAITAVRIDTIVRQREQWARDAVRDFGQGRSTEALQQFAERSLLIEADGPKATAKAMVDAWQLAKETEPNLSTLLIARTNAQVAVISHEVRQRLKAAGTISGAEVEMEVATPSGQTTTIGIAAGDQIRFLKRNDGLGVINGTTGTVVRISERTGLTTRIRIEANIEGRLVVFDPSDIADEKGRPQLGWSYATTVYSSQGLTVDRAFVALDNAFDRHAIHVAASRSTGNTTLFLDSRSIDRSLAAELPLDRQRTDVAFSATERREWLAARLERSHAKVSTVDVIEASDTAEHGRSRAQSRDREFNHEL